MKILVYGDMMTSYVYFITDDHNHIKIGKANNVWERLCELQTGNPYKLRILLTIELPHEDAAFTVEQYLHHKFEKDRMEGEWFQDINILKDLQRDELFDDDMFRNEILCRNNMTRKQSL